MCMSDKLINETCIMFKADKYVHSATHKCFKRYPGA